MKKTFIFLSLAFGLHQFACAQQLSPIGNASCDFSCPEDDCPQVTTFLQDNNFSLLFCNDVNAHNFLCLAKNEIHYLVTGQLYISNARIGELIHVSTDAWMAGMTQSALFPLGICWFSVEDSLREQPFFLTANNSSAVSSVTMQQLSAVSKGAITFISAVAPIGTSIINRDVVSSGFQNTAETSRGIVCYLQGSTGGTVNQLNLLATSEENTKNIIFEKSNDAKVFSAFDTLVAAGYSTVAKVYAALDSTPYATTYYRVRAIDGDNSVTTSNTISLSLPKEENNDMVLLYPNPTLGNSMVHIETAYNGPCTLTVSDMLGRIVWQERKQLGTELADVVVLPTNEVAAGVYVISVKYAQTNNISRLIVQK